MTRNPFELFSDWYAEAHGDPDVNPDTIALATATAEGRPSVRYVYFRGIRDGGFSFFTNYDSRKGRELAENPFAALAFYWPALARQVRVEGVVERVSSEESDAYWNSRPFESQVSASVSRQSRLLADEASFVAEIDRITQCAAPVPRPDTWGGFKVLPTAFEFWTSGAHRCHHRLRFEWKIGGWSSSRLYP